MTYFDELTKSMTMLAEHPKTLFVGQSVKYGGQAMFNSFAGVPMEKRIEFPVAENLQLGYCTGLSLEGYIPICIFPRIDFLLSAADQLVNHLDKIAQISGYHPKVIIRTAVGSRTPLNPGTQHTQNHVSALRHLLENIQVFDLQAADSIVPLYKNALDMKGSVIMVEHMSAYNGNVVIDSKDTDKIISELMWNIYSSRKKIGENNGNA